ncbi:MAG: DNA polymerase III subunit delta [Candidatus Aminicenantes bacterium RBG_16_63_16]|nr:MAG: DNA polymerase III subunit delta [Candidatus Aminicenantes bacterium RBG_16_63_16]
MAQTYPPREPVREDNLSPCYVFHGEETYLADQFIRQIRKVLLSPDGEPLNLERFDLEETGWAEILDVARTAPFFFAPWRILLVTAREDLKKKPSAAEEQKGQKKKADIEAKMIRDYCQSPAPKTVLIVVIPGNVRKGHALLKPFESLPAGSAELRDLKPLKGRKLIEWIETSVRPSGKAITSEGQKKLLELAGSDLRLLDNEIEKLITYAGDRRVIDVDDVTEVCDWGRSFEEWELINCLENADIRQALLVLHRLFREGSRPEYVLGAMAGLFRDLLLARLWLRENHDRKEIFRFVRPRVQEFWSDYEWKFRGFFDLVEKSSDDDLNRAVGELEKIDTLIKSTDVPAEAMISGFVIDYCRRRRRTKSGPEATSGKWG